MRPPAGLTADERRAWRDLAALVGDSPRARVGLEAACAQLARMRDARRRIEAEGEIVLDARDRPVPHPALVVERQAQAEVRRWVQVLSPPVAAGVVEPEKPRSALDELAERRRARP